MQLEVGTIVEGKVTGITNYGAFVELPEGKKGMVHISEVASAYVKEIRDFLSEGQTVKVKILSIAEDGKISLSIKRAQPEQEGRDGRERREYSDRRRPAGNNGQRSSYPPRRNYDRGSDQGSSGSRVTSFDWNDRRRQDMSFEDMMNKFKQRSDEKMSDLNKRSQEGKRGSGRGGRGSRE